jgi:Holliday junction DNA helicase RuvA
MIGWLIGKVRARDPASGRVVVDVAGVGYEVQVSMQTLGGVPELGGDVELHIHTHVREDQLTLFGFVDPRERLLFRMLTSVPKVGPRNAIAVLGGFPVEGLVECISGGDAKRLVRIPGIGKKTSEQIILTLGDKMGALLETATAAAEDGPAAPVEGDEPPRLAEARDVLLSLGWKNKPVDKALAPLTEAAETKDLDELVRMALANLMG